VLFRSQDIKLTATTSSDGVLNYGKRLNAIQQLFNQDFSDALL